MKFPLYTKPTPGEVRRALELLKMADEIQEKCLPSFTATNDINTFHHAALLCTTVSAVDDYMEGIKADQPDSASLKITAEKRIDAVIHNGGWRKPEMLEVPEDSIPEFPIGVFPKDVETYIESVSDAIQVPKAMAAAAALAAISTAAQGRFSVLHPYSTHTETTNLYILLSAQPGYRKSAVIEEFTKPVISWTEERRSQYATEKADYNAKIKALDAEISGIEKSLRNSDLQEDDRNALNEQLKKAMRLKETSSKPMSPAFLVDDVTAESLPIVMTRAGDQAAIISAEGVALQILGGLYTGGNPTNIQIFLKSYSGEYYSSNRAKGQNITMSHPLLTLCIFAQPEIVDPFLSNRSLSGQGLTDRFLIAMMPPKTQATRADNSGHSIDQRSADAFATTIKDLLDINRLGFDEIPKLKFADDAAKILIEYQQSIYDGGVEDGFLCNGLEEYSAKAPAQCERIAALLHILKHPCTPNKYANWDTCPTRTPISKETTESAINIHKYFIAQRIHKRDEINHDIAADAAKMLTKILKNTIYSGKAYTSRAAIKDSINRRSPMRDKVDIIIKDLQDAGFIDVSTIGDSKREYIFINPYVAQEELADIREKIGYSIKKGKSQAAQW